MPVCTHCHHPWRRWETIKSSFTIKPWMTCPQCNEKQYQTGRSRKRGSYYLIFVPITLLISQLLVPVAGWWSLVLYFTVIFAVFFYYYPTNVELTDEETPLW